MSVSTKHDGIKWSPYAHVAKYDVEVVRELTEYLGYEPKAADYARLSIIPNDEAEAHGNLLTTAGLQRITNLIIGAGGQAFASTATAAVGVGSTATAAGVGNTTLLADGTAENGTVGCRYQAVDSTPTAVNGVITAVSTFASGFGNFAWQEWCWAAITGGLTAANNLAGVGTTSEQMLNRKVASLGTKVSGASWVFTTTVTLS